MSLRWRIAVALGLLAGIATLIAGLASYRSTSDRLIAEVDRSLEIGMRAIPISPRGDVIALPVRGPLATYEVQVLDLAGSVRLTTFDTPIEPDVSARDTVGRPGDTVTTEVAVGGTEYRMRTVGIPRGAVQLARPLDETQRVLDSLRRRSIVMVVAVTAAAALAGFVIAGRVTSSLRRLTEAAETVGETGRLDVPVPVDGGDEVGRLGRSFQEMLTALARSRAEQRRLVEDAGHELRTPLTSARTNLDVLRRHPTLPAEEREQVLVELRSEIDELVRLVDEVVTVARGDLADEPFEMLSLGALANEVAQRFSRRTGRSVEVRADGSTVRGQPSALERAITNLLANAHKFDPSTDAIEVRIGEGSVEVLDRGPGIPPEELEMIFDRFHRAPEARTYPGSGLGLAIVREIIERHGGRVSARVRDGGGAAVGFSLPAQPSAEP